MSWQLATQESTATWDALFAPLYAKGRTGETTQLVVSDGAQGIENALERELSGVPHPRCIFHKIQNLADHLPCRDLVLDPAVTPAEATRKAKQARKHAL